MQRVLCHFCCQLLCFVVKAEWVVLKGRKKCLTFKLKTFMPASNQSLSVGNLILVADDLGPKKGVDSRWMLGRWRCLAVVGHIFSCKICPSWLAKTQYTLNNFLGHAIISNFFWISRALMNQNILSSPEYILIAQDQFNQLQSTKFLCTSRKEGTAVNIVSHAS